MKHYSRNKNFFIWYYGKGIHELLDLWENYLSYTWRHFNVWGLFATLFSPWKKDVKPKNWRGWNPSKSIQRILENMISRLIGSIIRSMVILLGLFLLLILILAGPVFILVWLVFPLVFIYVAIEAALGSILYAVFLGSLISYMGIIVSSYFVDSKIPYTEMDLRQIYSSRIFERIANRLGLTKKEFPKKFLKNDKELESFLMSMNLTSEDFHRVIAWETTEAERERSEKAFWRKENLKKQPSIGAQWKYAYTVHLDKYSIDLSRGDHSKYKDEDLGGREDEMHLLNLVLQRADQNSALVVGGAGIGKGTLIHTLARKIREGEIDSFLKNKRIVFFDLGRAISDSINRGDDVEGFVRYIFTEAAYAGNVILVIEHLEQFLGRTESAYHPNIAPVMGEFLDIPSFQIVATSSLKEYHSMVEKHDAVSKHFQVIEMREPNEDETMNIIYSNLRKFENSRVIFTHKAIKVAIKESAKYKWGTPLPERGLDLIMDSFGYWEKEGDSRFVTDEIVYKFIEMETGVPHGQIGNNERRKLLNLENEMHRHVIGQEEAIRQVAEALRRARSGIGNSEKPIGSFLFLGPTGVGKTETAKALARSYFGDADRMIRLDMSEFQSPSSIDRLIGSSSLNQQGRLINAVKDNPYSLILLDEIEKAYPDILDLFLQILDEGFITDAFGDRVNFRNTLIIATSNIGAQLIKEEVQKGTDAEEIRKKVVDFAVTKGNFRIEFLNRFDGVIFFRPLKGGELSSVVKLMLQKLGRRILEEKNIKISFDESMVDKIIQKGYNPVFGARSLNRYIEDTMEDILAKKIIAGEVKEGENVFIDL